MAFYAGRDNKRGSLEAVLFQHWISIAADRFQAIVKGYHHRFRRQVHFVTHVPFQLVHRQGGLERRIYGKQQKVSRGILWPKKMRELSINKLRICWYNTGDDNPLIVEYCLILEYLVRNKRLPAWNNELKLDSRLKNDLEIFIKDNNIEFLKIASTQ